MILGKHILSDARCCIPPITNWPSQSTQLPTDSFGSSAHRLSSHVCKEICFAVSNALSPTETPLGCTVRFEGWENSSEITARCDSVGAAVKWEMGSGRKGEMPEMHEEQQRDTQWAGPGQGMLGAAAFGAEMPKRAA